VDIDERPPAWAPTSGAATTPRRAAPRSVREREYEAIEAAVMETARGRWFLSEFARRNRAAETRPLLAALERLEGAVAADRETRDLDRLRSDLGEMAKAIALTRSEIAEMHPPDRQGGFVIDGDAFDAVAQTAERATCDVAEAAERMQEAAWTLRQGGADPGLCAELDRHATAIYTASSLHDLTARRTARTVECVRELETRIDEMSRFWGAPPGPRPPDGPVEPTPPSDRGQGEGDGVIRLGPPSAAADEAPLSGTLGEVGGSGAARNADARDDDEAIATGALRATIRVEAFADIDALHLSEKLKRFT
jgi:hypothetical protein